MRIEAPTVSLPEQSPLKVVGEKTIGIGMVAAGAILLSYGSYEMLHGMYTDNMAEAFVGVFAFGLGTYLIIEGSKKIF